jgi:hypothetical protein
MFVLLVLTIGRLDISSAAGVPRQKPNTIAIMKRLVVDVTKIAAGFQVERSNCVTERGQLLDQRRSDQPFSPQH